MSKKKCMALDDDEKPMWWKMRMMVEINPWLSQTRVTRMINKTEKNSCRYGNGITNFLWLTELDRNNFFSQKSNVEIFFSFYF